MGRAVLGLVAAPRGHLQVCRDADPWQIRAGCSSAEGHWENLLCDFLPRSLCLWAAFAHLTAAVYGAEILIKLPTVKLNQLPEQTNSIPTVGAELPFCRALLWTCLHRARLGHSPARRDPSGGTPQAGAPQGHALRPARAAAPTQPRGARPGGVQAGGTAAVGCCGGELGTTARSALPCLPSHSH